MLTPKKIQDILPTKTNNIFVAYSGGIDSHVMLHLIVSITTIKSSITAVYVDHGLQTEARAWAIHCRAVALALNINFQCLKVNAQKKQGQSPEEAARNARYNALKTLLNKNDVVLLAQHQQDQTETVLLQLFRGAGVQGLAGMPVSIRFGQGIMCRPLLDYSKQDIRHYAIENNLHWIEDPSNNRNDFDRNFLRNQIIPQLKERWVGLDKTVTRSARHCAENYHLTQTLAKSLFNTVHNETKNTLCIRRLLRLDHSQQPLVIRQWFQVQQLRMPSEKMLNNILNQVVIAKPSANPEACNRECCIKRFRDHLYCLTKNNKGIFTEKKWPTGSKQLQLNHQQKLMIVESSTGISKRAWQAADVSIKYRQGTEKIKVVGRTGHHTLKKLFQEKAIPPWERQTIPLIYFNDNLVAVADLWMGSDVYSTEKNQCYQIVMIQSA